MIKVITKEFVESDWAVRTTTVTFFGITIYKSRRNSTNRNAIHQLTPIKTTNKKIMGFNYETNNKSKKSKS